VTALYKFFIFINLLAMLQINCVSHAQQASQPPVALFGLDLTYGEASSTEYGISCFNSDLYLGNGYVNADYKNVKGRTFDISGQSPANAILEVKCNTESSYFTSKVSAPHSPNQYTVTCTNGQWSNNLKCIKQCKFKTSEFELKSIVQGRDVSDQTNAEQFEIKPFVTASYSPSELSVPQSNSYYYAHVGNSVKITCPDGYPPYTSDVTAVRKVNYDSNSFETTCLPETGANGNKWSKEIACYNGFKPCNNSEVTVVQSNNQITMDDGQTFPETGGSKDAPTGKTMHGAMLKLACNKYPWYQKFKYHAPKCHDGKWYFNEAWCKPRTCTPKKIFSLAGANKTNRVGYNIASTNANPDQKVYYNQTYPFQCKDVNRVGGRDGKAFRCNFDDYDRAESVTPVKSSRPWLHRYCADSQCYISNESLRNDRGGIQYLGNREVYMVNDYIITHTGKLAYYVTLGAYCSGNDMHIGYINSGTLKVCYQKVTSAIMAAVVHKCTDGIMVTKASLTAKCIVLETDGYYHRDKYTHLRSISSFNIFDHPSYQYHVSHHNAWVINVSCNNYDPHNDDLRNWSLAVNETIADWGASVKKSIDDSLQDTQSKIDQSILKTKQDLYTVAEKIKAAVIAAAKWAKEQAIAAARLVKEAAEAAANWVASAAHTFAGWFGLK
jgi:hypothetical protein